MASLSASLLRWAAFLTRFFIFEKASSSMGFRSGEYGGKNREGRTSPTLDELPPPGRRTGDGARPDIACLLPHLQPALYARQGDAEDPDNLPTLHAAVDGVQHLEPEILRIRFPANKYL